MSTTGQMTFGNNVTASSTATGIYWHSTSPNGSPDTAGVYGIFRTPEAWTSPYAQLEMEFPTGIIIDGGVGNAKSGTVLQPNGGYVGIGTTSPGSTLEVNGHIKSLQTYQTGSVTVNGSGTWQTVTFPTAFASTPVVTANMSNLVGSYYGFVVIRGSTLSTTSFQFTVTTMQNMIDTAGDTISWIAVAQ